MDTNSYKLNRTVPVLIGLFDYVNITLYETPNSVNGSGTLLKDLYEDYRMKEKQKLLVYRSIAYVVGVLIIVSNLSVVVSSGLILKKGQKPKSTYILLGNVSLADTIVGFSIVYGISNEYILSTSAMCVFQMGMLVCPAMVSIFSVGLIAIDRYIYILHGLYYQRWFNTTRVRIGIVLIWMISITLGFMPATGWVSHELKSTRCYYFSLFPGPLVLLNSLLSIIPIIIVTVLYAIILFEALKTVKSINNTTVKAKTVSQTLDVPKLRIHRRVDNTNSATMEPENNDPKLKRSASFNFGTACKPKLHYRSKSIDDLSIDIARNTNPNNLRKNDKRSRNEFESFNSVCTIETMASSQNLNSIYSANNLTNQVIEPTKVTVKQRKIKEPNKWRAIKVVMLTSGGFIFTWLPFFITVIFFVFCEDKLINPRCVRLRALLGGPLPILAFVNSILNPLIYAWWHKGFQRSVKAYYKQCLRKCICHVVR